MFNELQPQDQAAIAADQCEAIATELSYEYPTDIKKITELREKAKQLRIKASSLGYIFKND